MKIKLTRVAIHDTNLALSRAKTAIVKEVKGEVQRLAREYPIYFEHFLHRNQQFLKSEMSAMQEVRKTKLADFDVELDVLRAKHKIEGNTAPSVEALQAFDAAVATLSKDERFVAKLAEWDMYMQEEVEVECYGIELSRVENLVLPEGVYTALRPLFTVSTEKA